MSDTPFFESELFAELKEDLTQSSRFTATYRIAAPDYEKPGSWLLASASNRP